MVWLRRSMHLYTVFISVSHHLKGHFGEVVLATKCESKRSKSFI